MDSDLGTSQAWDARSSQYTTQLWNTGYLRVLRTK